MSDFFFGGPEDGGDFAGLLHGDGVGDGQDWHGDDAAGFDGFGHAEGHDAHGYGAYGYDAHGYDAYSHEGHDDHLAVDPSDDPTDDMYDTHDTHESHDEPADGDGFDLDATGFDHNLTFDASYDLMGHDPDESGWWDTLTSDHNHDGAYETVSYDTHLDPHVVH